VLLADTEDCEVCEAMGSDRTRRSADGVFRTAAGARFPAEYVARPFRRGGVVAGAVVTFSDVTERRRAERALLEGARVPARAAGQPARGHRRVGPRRAGRAGQRRHRDGHEHLVLPDGRTPLPAEESPLARAYRGEHVRDVELVVAAPHTEPRTVVVNGQPVVGREGRRLGAVMTLHDITERRRAEQAKDEFIALVSHELRTPLTSILGYLEVLVGGGRRGRGPAPAPPPLPHDDRAQRAPPAAPRRGPALRRPSSRPAASPWSRRHRPGRAREGRGRRRAAQVGRPRRVPAPRRDRPGAVRRGRRALGQVVDNLVANALKFTGVGGSIIVSAGTDAEGVWIEVADTGIGIPADELDRLFERFFRASSATEREIPGVGLGLAISKAIVEGHDGPHLRAQHRRRGHDVPRALPAEPVALAA
jgi:signal transduction histidine kinase